ncbi:MAG: ABC transporter substrate-binding protein [Planctomycetota bacterium]|jgi:peptide/nickel transport system substrate-binding protein
MIQHRLGTAGNPLLLLLPLIFLLLVWSSAPALPQEPEDTGKVLDCVSQDRLNPDRDSLLPPEERNREPEFGGVITTRFPSEPRTLNNLTRADGYGRYICAFLYPTLLQLDPDSMDFIPFAAKELPEISEDGKTQTWRLRKGLKWDDHEESGAFVTTRDIRLSFDLLKDPEAKCHAYTDFVHLVSLNVIDDHTFKVRFDVPNADAIFKMGTRFRIVPAHILEDVAPAEVARDPIGRAPVGFGSFRFEHWKPNQEILIVRNDLNRNLFPKKFRPYADGIRWRIISNADLVMQSFLKGDMDLFGMTHDMWKHHTEKEPFIGVGTRHNYFIPWWNYIAWNNESIFFEDLRVRQAMTHMLRRDEVLNSHLYGLGKVLSGPFYYFSKGYDHSIESLQHDPERSKELLKEAGWMDRDGDGILDREIDGKRHEFEFTLLLSTASQPYQDALLLAFQEDLRKAGIIMKLRRLEWAAFQEQTHQRKYDAMISGFSTKPIFEDPYEKWHSSLVKDRGVNNNKALYQNPEVDALVENIRTEFDDEKRYALMKQVHALIHRDQPFTFLYSYASLVGINKRWRNVKIHRLGCFMYEWWLPPENRKPSDQLLR